MIFVFSAYKVSGCIESFFTRRNTARALIKSTPQHHVPEHCHFRVAKSRAKIFATEDEHPSNIDLAPSVSDAPKWLSPPNTDGWRPKQLYQLVSSAATSSPT